MDPFIPIADNVWLMPANALLPDNQVNIGIVQLETQTILINAGNSPAYARHMLGALMSPQFAPVNTIIYTQHHWTHVFGAGLFGARHVIAQDNCATILHEWKNRSWSEAYLQDEINQKPRYAHRNTAILNVIDDWRSFRIITPNITFARRMTLIDGNMTFILTHVGDAETDIITVGIPERRVLFIGDVWRPLQVSAFTQAQPSGLHPSGLHPAIWQSLMSDDYDIYVDGVHPPMQRAQLANLIAEQSHLPIHD